MRVSQAFPSKYLKCSDLQGRTVTVTISTVEMETLGEDHRPVVYFKGKQKGLVLNKTNAGVIADMYGDDTDAWEEKPITLRPARVDFRGERVDAIRVEFIQPPVRQAAPPVQPQQQPARGSLESEMNDEIPF